MNVKLPKIILCLIMFCLVVVNVVTQGLVHSEIKAPDVTQPAVTLGPSMTTTTTATTTEPTTTTTTETRPTVKIDLPYYIEVDKQKKVVSIYTTNEEGKYEKLVRQMICATEEDRGKFPDGMYQLSLENRRFEWRMMKSHGESMYAQYACTISGDFMFHSVPYETQGDKSSLYEWRFKELGTACTGGCIRLTVEGAKWIYDNCPPGTPVCIMRSDSFDAELVESLRPADPVGGWDPTDPDPKNPNYKPLITTPDPQPDLYAPLYDYNFKWAPPCTTATFRTTTTTAAPAETTAAAPSESTAAAQ